MKKIFIFSNVNPTKSYSGLKYLAEALQNRGYNVTLYAKIPVNDLGETNHWKCEVKSFYDTWYGRIPLFRRYMTYIHIFLLIFFKQSHFIFHELTFFRLLYICKKIFKNKKCIHYATELYTVEDEPSHKNILKFYEKFCNLPDLIIECEENRKLYRKKLYGINQEIVVIPNTIPIKELNTNKNISLKSLAGITEFPEDYKIIVYTGAAYLHRELDRLIDGISGAKTKCFFLAFCYGPTEEIEITRKYAKSKLKQDCLISNAKPREEILSCLNQADAGIVYYRPSLSIGNEYAAPTKFFEYIASGLPVISSNNIGLKQLIDKYNLGICVNSESIEDIGNAIDTLFIDEIKFKSMKNKLQDVYRTSLSYEMLSIAALDKIEELLRD